VDSIKEVDDLENLAAVREAVHEVENLEAVHVVARDQKERNLDLGEKGEEGVEGIIRTVDVVIIK
jgi:hypothetical protein